MSKRKPGMRSIDEWELDGLEILAEQDASAQSFEEVQIEEQMGLIEWQKEQDLQYAIAKTMPQEYGFDEADINLKYPLHLYRATHNQEKLPRGEHNGNKPSGKPEKPRK